MTVSDVYCFQTVCEPGGKFWSMIRLDHFKYKRRYFSCVHNKIHTLLSRDSLCYFCICPPRIQIDERVDVHLLSAWKKYVNGINLYQCSCIQSSGSRGGIMWSLPWRSLFEQSKSAKCSLN